MPPIPPHAKRPSADTTAAPTTNATACRLVALPDDILVAFLFALPIPDMLRFAATCRDIHKLMLDAELWRMLTLNAGLNVDHPGAGHSSDGEEAATAVPNTVAAYKSKLVDAIRTRIPAHNSFHGAWMGGDSPHISPRPDSDAIHGQALGVNVWWLEIGTSFIIPNGTWHLVLRSKSPRYADLDNVDWIIESMPTPPHHSAASAEFKPTQTWQMTLSSDVLPNDDQYAWTLFSSPSSPSSTSDYPLLLRADSPFDLTTCPPRSCMLSVYSPTGFSRVNLTLKDINTQRYKYGWMLDEVAWIRAERWSTFVEREIQKQQPGVDVVGMAVGAAGAVAQGVVGVMRRVLGGQ